jgi:hypothetical protein
VETALMQVPKNGGEGFCPMTIDRKLRSWIEDAIAAIGPNATTEQCRDYIMRHHGAASEATLRWDHKLSDLLIGHGLQSIAEELIADGIITPDTPPVARHGAEDHQRPEGGGVNRRRMRLVAMAAAVALACLPAAAADSGNVVDLWSQCTDKDSSFATGVCYGYVKAIAEVMAVSPKGVHGFRACFPAENTWRQAVDAVKRYLDQNPGKRHFAGLALVPAALAEAFPCDQ